MTLPDIANNFLQKSIVSLDQFDRKSVETLFKTTDTLREQVEGARVIRLFEGIIATLLFYEPSSRTFSSFATAVKKLGGQTIEYQNPNQTSSAVKGETLEDTVNVFENFADIIIIRHAQAGAVKKAAEAAFSKPVINAGDGAGEHPTQALLDLYTINRKHGTLDNLTGLIAGDLLNGRTVHSLLKGFSLFKKNTVYLLSPKQLRLEKSMKENIKKKGVKLIEIEKETDIPKHCDFWYWTRVQKERFADLKDYERVKHSFILTPELVKKKAGTDTILLHPLPRVGEIDPRLDSDPRALYLTTQIRNGLFVRMALLSLVLGKI